MHRCAARAEALRRADEHGILNLERHRRAVFIGDLHGDLMVLLAVLEACGAIRPLHKNLRKHAFRCHVGDGRGKLKPLTNEEVCSVAWNGDSMAVVLLGDVLDNRRGGDHDEYGVCGLPGTQQTILSIIQRLHTQAARVGGRMIWVLGNHCCGNVTRGPNRLSADYAPRFYVTRQGTVGHVSQPVPDGREFTPQWRHIVLRHMDACQACAVLLVQLNSIPIAVAMHGFPMKEFGEAVGACDATNNSDGARHNVRFINHLYERFLHELDAPPLAQVYHERPDCLPTWCRARPGATTEAARASYNCQTVIKAHDPQPRVTCAGDVCFADMAMSRAFRAEQQVAGTHVNHMGYLEMDENGAIVPRHFSASYEAQ